MNANDALKQVSYHGPLPTSREVALQAQLERLRRHFGDLLATIHGDGGQYQAEHGDEKATADAIEKWARLMGDARAPNVEVDLAATRSQLAEAVALLNRVRGHWRTSKDIGEVPLLLIQDVNRLFAAQEPRPATTSQEEDR